MPPDEATVHVPTIAGVVPVTDIMSKQVISARGEDPIEAIIELLRRHHVGCIPIVDDLGRAKGILTKLDLLECQAESRYSAREVMMPLAMTLDTHATVAQAAALMSRELVHHVLVVDDERRVVGVVSSLDIAHWLAANDGLLG